MTHLARDVRFGLRLLWQTPGYTAAALAALALGIAGTTVIFSVVYATLYAPLPYPHPEQAVIVWSQVNGERSLTSAGDFLDWRRCDAFQSLHAWTGWPVALAGAERPEQVDATVVTPGMFASAGERFEAGRDFLPEEGQVGSNKVVILGNRLWKERFGADRGIVGRNVRIDGEPHTVVGIFAAGSTDRGQAQLSLPLAFRPEQLGHDRKWLLVQGRIRPGTTLQQANAALDVIARQIAEAHPGSNKDLRASVEPLRNNFLDRSVIRALWLLFAAVGFVLLIACTNVANLLLARGTARQREIAVRAALGAGRARLFGQLLTESLVLSAIGGVLGVALAFGLLQVVLAAMPQYTLPNEADVRLNLPVLAFTLAASAAAGVLFGCVPAWQATRVGLDVTLKQEGRTSSGSGRRLRRALVVAEFALALPLLAGGGSALHGLTRIMTTDLGFRTDRLLTFSLPVPSDRLPDAERIRAFYAQLVERTGALPGVEEVSISTGMPGRGAMIALPFEVEGRPKPATSGVVLNLVGPDHFRTFGIPLSSGRSFDASDRSGAPRVAIVNELFARRYLAGLDPLRQRLLIPELAPGAMTLGKPVSWQIVGVYGGVKNAGPQGEDYPEIDVPFAQSPWPAAMVAVRTAGEPAAVERGIAAILTSLDSELPMADVSTMDQVVAKSFAGPRFTALLFGTFAAFALALATLGIYGVMSFAVAQRTRELGLRMALGAPRARLLRSVLSEGLSTSLLGIAVGSAGGYAMQRWLQSTSDAMGRIVDPLSFSVVVATLLASALAACYVPARRAASVDPMTALRQD